MVTTCMLSLYQHVINSIPFVFIHGFGCRQIACLCLIGQSNQTTIAAAATNHELKKQIGIAGYTLLLSLHQPFHF